MTRDALESLSVRGLIELILRHEARIAQLNARIHELEAQLSSFARSPDAIRSPEPEVKSLPTSAMASDRVLTVGAEPDAVMTKRQVASINWPLSSFMMTTQRITTHLLHSPAFVLAAGIVALIVAGIGEYLVRQHNQTPLSPILYLIGIIVFTVSAWGVPAGKANRPAAENDAHAQHSNRRWLIGVGGVILALGLSLVAVNMLRADLKSATGAWLWIASLIVLMMTGIALHRGEGWPARWGADVFPHDQRARYVLIGGLVVLMALAAAARLLWLDKVPLGINADEGDRAAVSISIIRGTNPRSIFDSGWYYISMMYFTLLAQFFNISGIGFVQARIFTALFGIASVATITWLGIRHFGLRVGLLTGFLLSLLGIALQFARETSEAGITALFWAMSLLLFLEAARRGKTWAWIGAGLAGGYSIYFYPTGRLWALAAALYCLYLIVHGLGGRRRAIIRGAILAALASFLVSAPFFANVANKPGEFALRFEQTSAFVNNNATRLAYYKPSMTTEQLLLEQVVHSVGVFNQFPDGGGFWPTRLPLMPAALALLTLLGIGWCSLRWRDPRIAALTIWFWVSLLGVITTVETPNVQRLATAISIITFFPVLVFDNLARRVEQLMPFAHDTERRGQRLLRWAPAVAAALLVAAFMWNEGAFYFVDYASMERWAYPNAEGNAVNSQGTNSLVLTLGTSFHMINQGWIRLLAPDVSRAGIQSPGMNLPLTMPADRDLAFMLYPKQSYYLPYLNLLYPGGSTIPYIHPTEGRMFTFYRVSQQQWADAQGAMVEPPQGEPTRVRTLSEAPNGWNAYPSNMRWTAGLHVPRYWNYMFQVGPGPARLIIDQVEVLSVPAGTPVLSATVALAHGDHFVELEGSLTTAGQPALLQWAQLLSDNPMRTTPWQTVPTENLIATQNRGVGLFGLVQMPGRPAQHRLDRTLATCCLREEVLAEGRPYTVTWTGNITAPVSGQYGMSLFAQGEATLRIDGQTIIRTDSPSDTPITGTLNMSAGAHPVQLVYQVSNSPGGLEWAWTPPGGTTSIIPFTMLSPPPRAGIEMIVPFSVLGQRDLQPTDLPPAIIQ